MQYEKMRRNGGPRWFVKGSNIYIIRDVWKRGGFLTDLDHCEYGVWDENYSQQSHIKWKRCEEGLKTLANIEPIGTFDLREKI